MASFLLVIMSYMVGNAFIKGRGDPGESGGKPRLDGDPGRLGLDSVETSSLRLLSTQGELKGIAVLQETTCPARSPQRKSQTWRKKLDRPVLVSKTRLIFDGPSESDHL